VVLVITTSKSTYSHDCDHGFCVICGSVWPCSRARRGGSGLQQAPIARLDYYDY
jgi:hypothetical protein